MLGPMNLARICLSKRRNRVLNVLLRDGLVAGGQVLAIENLLEVPPNKLFVGL
jgi:hypothetical protein